ncbi:MAG TPA: hypothetical protein VNT26_14970, partial [Candidatus Sulfotelmatobacter sp.]|nr:hypothetical protein [Candidatus Sulfotelmatobacter sp.]
MKNITKFLMLAASLSLVPNLTQAASSIGVDFSGDGPGANGWFLSPQDSAGVVPQANWNMINTMGGGDDIAVDRGTSGTLLNATGQATRVRLQYSGNDSWNTSGLTDTPNGKLMKGTLKHDASAGPLLLSFTNLDAGTYDVYVYGNVDGGPVDVDVSIGTATNYWTEPAAYDEGVGFYPASSTDPAARMEGNYVKFTGVSTVNSAITVYAFHRGGGNGVGVAAVQIVTAGTFPPFQGATAMGAQEQVKSATVYTLTEAAFRFVATNNAVDPIPVTYQWYKNGQAMTNATGQQFTFLAGAGDNGAKVYCLASMPEALNPNHLSLTSATGIVTVLPGVNYTNGLKVEVFPGATRQEVEAGNVGP